MLYSANCLSIYQVFTNLHVILGQGSPQTVASDTIALLLLLAKRSGGEIFIKSNKELIPVTFISRKRPNNMNKKALTNFLFLRNQTWLKLNQNQLSNS